MTRCSAALAERLPAESVASTVYSYVPAGTDASVYEVAVAPASAIFANAGCVAARGSMRRR
jgi:hypothetical protein